MPVLSFCLLSSVSLSASFGEDDLFSSKLSLAFALGFAVPVPFFFLSLLDSFSASFGEGAFPSSVPPDIADKLLFLLSVLPLPIFATPLLRPATILPPAYAPASTPQPFLSPASMPNNLSTIFGPSITATENAIRAIKYAKPFNWSARYAVPIMYTFMDKNIKIITRKVLRIDCIIFFVFCPSCTSAGAIIMARI